MLRRPPYNHACHLHNQSQAILELIYASHGVSPTLHVHQCSEVFRGPFHSCFGIEQPDRNRAMWTSHTSELDFSYRRLLVLREPVEAKDL